MSRRKSEPPTPEPERMISVPIRMPKSLDSRLQAAADRTTLGKQAVMRLALERGIDVLIRQLSSPVSAAGCE